MRKDDEARWRSLLAPLPAPPDLSRRVLQAVREARASAVARLAERLEIAATPAGVTRLRLGRGRTVGEDRQARRWAEQARVELAEYLDGRRSFFTVPVDLGRLAPFQREVLEAAQGIPFGEVRPYRWVAEAIGRPRAVRAVGQALGANPVPLIVPCHRVVPAGGGSGGYIFGGEVKERLLNLERSTPALVGNTRDRIVCRLGCPPVSVANRRRWQTEELWVAFASLAEARTAGYRPCNVCRPAA